MTGKPLLAICFILLGTLSTLALAAAPGSVERVIVYPDRAEVVRRMAVDLAAGGGHLLVADLPVGLDREGLRLSLTEAEDARLGTVEIQVRRGSERVLPRARELEERIREEEARLRETADRITAAELQYAFLQGLTQPGKGDRPEPDAWVAALRSLGSSAETVLATRRAAERERDELQRSLDALRRQLADLGSSQRDHVEVRIAYETARAQTAMLRLTYVVPGVQWEPVYEWRLDSEARRLEIVQRAALRQESGEDWPEAQLEFALGRPQQGGRLPTLAPWYVGPLASKHARAGVAMDLLRESTPQASAATAPAELTGTPFSARYTLPNRVSVPGDGSRLLFDLARHSLEVELEARAVPKRQTQAWLFAEGRYEGEVPLPAGPASLFQDGALVGRIRFEGMAPGSALARSFGVDDRIRIRYVLQHDRKGTDGLLRRQQRRERAYLIEVENGHRRPMPITIIDQLPQSRDERIRIELSADTDEPSERNIDNEPGLLAWSRVQAAGERRQIRFGYQATYPQEIEDLDGW